MKEKLELLEVVRPYFNNANMCLVNKCVVLNSC